MTGKRKRGTAYNPTKTNKRKKKGEFHPVQSVEMPRGKQHASFPQNNLCSGIVLTPALASVVPSSPHPHGDYDEEEYYQLRTVLKERIVRKKVEYLIDWEDNKLTGEKYTPTWEPKENLTERALADWEAVKLARQAGMCFPPFHSLKRKSLPS